jgi:hypothetical protein
MPAVTIMSAGILIVELGFVKPMVPIRILALLKS